MVGKVLGWLIIIYLIIQLAGILYMFLGYVHGSSYILGWITGALAALIFFILLISAILKEEAKRIVEILISKIL